MEVSKPADSAEVHKPVTREPSPEVAVYLHLLVVIHLIDKKQIADVCPVQFFFFFPLPDGDTITGCARCRCPSEEGSAAHSPHDEHARC